MPSPRIGADRPLPAGYGGVDAFRERIDRLLSVGGREEEIGRTRSDRPLRAYRWDPPLHPSSPLGSRVLLLSLLHPMEWIGLETHLAFLESLLLGRPEEAMGKDARRFLSLASIPIANPDGFERVEASLRSGRPRWIRGNLAGVDLNRNFPVGHRARGPFGRRWPLYRPGPFPLSEPETNAIARFARSFQPEIAISLHSFGRRIYVSPAYRRALTPSSRDLLARASSAAELCGYRAAVLGRWAPWFRARGTELDFLHLELGARSYLVELSGGGFGRWGMARLGSPFHLFNPPRPEAEIRRVLPALERLLLS